MKKYLSYIKTLLLTICLLPLITACYNKESREEILKVYNWADYIDEQVLEDFPKWYEQRKKNPDYLSDLRHQ